MSSRLQNIGSVVTAVVLGLLTLPLMAAAAPPALLPLQGYLTDDSDAALDGVYQLNFTLYDDALSGSSLYSTTEPVSVGHGNFTVYLGDQAPLDFKTLRDHDSVWLEIKFVKNCGSDTTCATGTALSRTLAPRLQLGSTAFAASASYCTEASTLLGKAPSDFVAGNQTCTGMQKVTGLDAAGKLVCGSDVDTNTTYSGANFATSSQACTGTQKVTGVDAAGKVVCGADVDTNTTYSGANFATSAQACGSGQVAVGISGSGALQCMTDATYVAGSGLSLVSNQFALNSAGCSSGYVLKWTGSAWTCQNGAIATSATTATTANNLAGGSAGSLPYQSAGSTTAMLASGNAGSLLVSGGAGAPAWLAGTASGQLLHYDPIAGWVADNNIIVSGAALGIGIVPADDLHVYNAKTASILVDGQGTNSPSVTSQVHLMRPSPRRAAGMLLDNAGNDWFVGEPYDAGLDRNEFHVGYRGSSGPEYRSMYMFRIDSSGNATLRGALTQGPSDARLKKNIRPIDDALETMTRLRGVSFEWKDPAAHGNQVGPRMGMIAQQVEQVLPGWVSTDDAGMKAVTYIGFEGLTVEAVRELKTGYEQLKAQNTELQASNAVLEARLDRLERLLEASK